MRIARCVGPQAAEKAADAAKQSEATAKRELAAGRRKQAAAEAAAADLKVGFPRTLDGSAPGRMGCLRRPVAAL